jgi:ATP phosphoribosyltransferase
MSVAAKEGFRENKERPLRVATKFVNIASEYYSSLNREIEIIKLNGSIELAPILDMSDVIVDIVETGTTLKNNNMKVISQIMPISARLIANKTSYKFKSGFIDELTEKLAEAIK